MDGPSVQRGEVYLANLEREGGRLRKLRPVLVIQNDRGNLYSFETIVVGIRNPRRDKHLPIRVFVRKGTGGIRQDSDIDAGQLNTIRKSALGPLLGTMPREVMAAVDIALKKSLALR